MKPEVHRMMLSMQNKFSPYKFLFLGTKKNGKEPDQDHNLCSCQKFVCACIITMNPVQLWRSK